MKKNELENLLRKATEHIQVMQKDIDIKSAHIGLLANILIANMLELEQLEITYDEKVERPYEVIFSREENIMKAKLQKV